jgi:hypothetical protein
MNEEKALSLSSGWVKTGNLVGYLPFKAANFLVGTGKYRFEQVCCWGYVLRKRAKASQEGCLRELLRQ